MRRFHILIFAAVFSSLLIFALDCAAADAQSDTGVPETISVYGHSVDGRPLTAVTLGDGNNVTMILGGIHGNEHSAPGLVEDLKSYLEHHTEALDGCTVVLVPHVNPDGDAAGTRANADGVDLNRNFPVDWMPKRPGIELSPGTEPLSEPEASALVSLLKFVKPSKLISVHQPFGCLLPSGPGGETLAHTMSAASGYKVLKSVGYPTPGSFGSYCYRTCHIAAVTLELPPVSVSKAWAANQSALLAAIQLPTSAVAE